MALKTKDKAKPSADAAPAVAIEDLFTSLNRHIQRSEYDLAVKVSNQVMSIAPGDEDAIRSKVVALIKTTQLMLLYRRLKLIPRNLQLISVSSRMEMEADYIGLLLLAVAGFDRRVAPQVYEKLGEVSGQSALQDYLATHPSGEKRAQVLSQAKVMEKALSIYRETQSGQGVEGFL